MRAGNHVVLIAELAGHRRLETTRRYHAAGDPTCRAEGGIDRHHWELCLLSELRGALRAGEIWVQSSRRYMDPERFLISRSDRPTARPSVLHELELPAVADDRIGLLLERTARHRDVLDRDLQAADADATIGEQGNLSVNRLRAEVREPDVDALAKEIANQLPVIDPPALRQRSRADVP